MEQCQPETEMMVAAAMTSKKDGKGNEDKETLIKSHLSTPPQQNNEDDKDTESESDNEELDKQTTEKIKLSRENYDNHHHTSSPPCITINKKLPVSETCLDSSKSASAVATQGLETLVILQ